MYGSAEILVIDGESNDGTKELCNDLNIKWVKQITKGKGAALREAADLANNSTLIFFDGDCSHDPSDIQRLVDPILNGRYKPVSGSRMLGGQANYLTTQGIRLG